MKAKIYLIFFFVFFSCPSSYQLTINPFEDTRRQFRLPESIESEQVEGGRELKRIFSPQDLCWEGIPPVSGETWNYPHGGQVEFTWPAETYLFPVVPSSKIHSGDLHVSITLTFAACGERFLYFKIDGLTYDVLSRTRCEVLILAQAEDKQFYLWACLPVVSSTRAKSGLAIFKLKDLEEMGAETLIVIAKDDLTGKMRKGVISIH